MSGTRMSPFDLLDLLLLQAAKVRRVKLEHEDGREAFYDAFFTDLDERVLSSLEDPRKQARLDAVCAGVEGFARPGTLLDVGCGCGDTLLRLSRLRGHRLHGVEYAAPTVERARRVLGERAEVSVGSALELPYPDAHFEAVTCTEVLEHVSDDERALDEIFRVLRPDGVLVLTVPYRHYFKAYRTLMGHERHYDRAYLTELLRRHGFEVIHHLPNFPRWHRAFDYAFVLCRALGMLSSRLGRPGDPHEVRLPFAKRPLLQILEEHMGWIREKDGRLDYATLPSSTSVVARKLSHA